LLCEHLLSLGAKLGASIGYLQVDAANAPALSVYRRLGFVDGYAYHYRALPSVGD
jgi:ribosomal protein S18 acetylase RimI-like enzyme